MSPSRVSKFPLLLALLALTAVMVAAGCGNDEITLETACSDYLDHPDDERSDAAVRLSSEAGVNNAGNPMWAASLDQACGSNPDLTIGDYFDGGQANSTTNPLSNCTPDQLDTVSSNALTIATDTPAYPPYFEDNDPANGKGFESAVGYAIADKLGYSADQVEWTVVPFNASYAPGPKDFDFDLNQISITPKRAEAVDFSSPYYTANQAVVALPGTLPDDLTTTGDLADATIGVQIGTTSLDAVEQTIAPNEDPQVFDTSNDVVSALENGQVDAVVVDTPTALYLTAAQVPKAEIVGEFAAPGEDSDEWGALLEKDSSLTSCVSAAVDELKSSGELDKIQQQWINSAGGVPTLD